MKYQIVTYGCQMNKSDSERIAAVLEKTGYSPTLKEDKADILILVACSVRQSAIDRIYGLISNIKNKKSKIQIKNQKIILTGCILAKDKEKLKGKVDFILDINDLQRWPEIILKFKTPAKGEARSPRFAGEAGQRRQNLKLQLKTKNYLEIQPHYSTFPIAYVPISIGCNNFCTYCVVPYTRGPEKSRPVDEIINEVKSLIKNGYKEIVLLGQNVNSYVSRINTNLSTNNTNIREISLPRRQAGDQIRKNSRYINFPKLLKMINNIPGKFWLRFITSHPKDLSDELIKTMAKCEKVCEYLHLPVQSGDNQILKKMNRGYTVEYYKKLIRDIRGKFAKIRELPISISTDIIVGFPDETKKQFENTAKLMRLIKFDMAYIAQYSPRLGTAASKLKDNVLIKEKEGRRKVLTEILKKTALENNQKYLGQTVEILLDNQKNVHLYGKTKTFKTVRISPPRSGWGIRMDAFGLPKSRYSDAKKRPNLKIGQFIGVKIISAAAWGLEGKLI